MHKFICYLLFLVVALPILTLSQCQELTLYRQKLTVSIDTSEGTKSSSGVQKAHLTHTKWGPAGTVGATSGIIGESFAIEVTNGKYIFPLLSTIPLAPNVIYPKTPLVESVHLLSEIEDSAAIELTRDQYPTFVMFRHPESLEGAVIVTADTIKDVFGPDVRIRSITLAATNERMTFRDYTKVLPYVPDSDHEYWHAKRPFKRVDFRRSVPPPWMPDFLRDFISL